MRSTARLAGHPVHPMLIPYPFALLSVSTMFDVLDSRTRGAYGRTAGHLLDAGLLAGAAAAVPGLIDYVGTVPRGTSASRQATWHAAINGSALLAFLLARRERGRDGATSRSGLALSLLGTALLGAGGWLGGELVYHHHIGVDEDAGARRREREATLLTPVAGGRGRGHLQQVPPALASER
ncbi:membrane protein [Luteitalea sp. TBR-22]|uniref:DUF2231 domain-containing protein n=1 Tax=Luteitalea sp. TBR-22 TaxID=2802971 RepID=UPI001AF3C23A|nr:DUF2231 domain-containing protein [Luteitalea sp. TBR-22]BCS34257.1 membrane protein [Luteitalea sp. TBR-22]